MKSVYSSAYVAECDLFRVQLALAGIRSTMTNEFGNSIGLAIIGGAATFTWPEVMVEDGDYERASAFAQAFIASSKARSGAQLPGELSEWRCPKCGESVDGTLLACWKCESVRTGA